MAGVLKLNGTSGFVQLQAAATAGSNTLTLPTNNGSTGQFLQTDGSGNLSFATALSTAPVTSVNAFTGAIQSVITAQTTQASTSGTSITFTGIPSWVKRITITIINVSTNGTNQLRVRIGPSGGVETTGYVGASASTLGTATATQNFSQGFDFYDGQSTTAARFGTIILEYDSGVAIWTVSSVLSQSNEARVITLSGAKSVTGALSQVAITTVGSTDTFDSGAIALTYE